MRGYTAWLLLGAVVGALLSASAPLVASASSVATGGTNSFAAYQLPVQAITARRATTVHTVARPDTRHEPGLVSVLAEAVPAPVPVADQRLDPSASELFRESHVGRRNARAPPAVM